MKIVKMKSALLFICIFSFLINISAQQENWPGFEGGNLHRNSSAYDIPPSTLGVLWKRNFDKIIKLTNAWSYCKPDGNYGSRNLSITNGYIPIVAFDGIGAPSNLSFEKIGYVTILNCRTGQTVNMFKATIADGPRHCNADGSDDVRGLAVLNWDALTNILFIMNGGDGSGFSAYSPLANTSSYQFGIIQNGAGAYSARPTVKEAVYPTPGPNETSFFELDPLDPIICYMSGSHSVTSGICYGQKFLGDVIGTKLNNNFPAVPSPFAKWGGVLTGNKHLFCMGPADEASQKGLNLWSYHVTYKDNFNHGKDSLSEIDMIELDTAFFYSVPSKSAIARESYNELDGTYRNKAWLIDGNGLWAAWKPDKAGNSELIYCDDSGIQQYDLGICAGTLGQNVWPHISLAETGGSKYIVYYAALADNDSKIAVFNATTKTLKWNYNISANYSSLLKSPLACYNDISQMMVAGKYAYVGWIDVAGTEAALKLLCFDITAATPAPVLKNFPLGYTSAGFTKSFLTDLASANGIMYALITKSDSLGGALWASHVSKWQAQMIYALSENPDIIPPTKPTNLYANPISTTFLTLNWSPSVDSVAVFYKIYQDGKLIVETQDTSYKAVALTNGKTYKFVIEPVDLAGNVGNKDSLLATPGNYTNRFIPEISDKISIYPNPAADVVHIVSEDVIHHLIICDVTGRKVVEMKNAGFVNLAVDVSFLSPGVYIISAFTSTSKTRTLKFIKE